ncbi:hypothetical protein GRI58_15175 [Porphyrobacter algicida]|uniref:Uncharacterized protein n=1 Tax=Qipengyuania algicida TaxID=1836209 RepID=A0A845AIR5_9SPHN|nr:hypothetical protein [Qipengyuania algicida]MXP30150.1 hypothetical protein [Qipengyuania algicida]
MLTIRFAQHRRQNSLTAVDNIAVMASLIQNALMNLPPYKPDEPHWLQIERRRRFNDAGREIWFSRILWSYFPIHWKGFAVTLVGIALTLVTCFLIDRDMSGIFAVPMLAGIAIMIWICERHSPTRS